MYRIMYVVLVLTIVILCLVSCADEKKPSVITTTSAQTEDEVTTENEEMKALETLSDADFEGHLFTFLCRSAADIDPAWIPWDVRDIYAEEENGDPINDATFKRNLYVKEKYNCDIKQISSSQYVNELSKTIRAGDSVYDVVVPHIHNLVHLGSQDFLLNINDFPEFDSVNPWWDENSFESLSLCGKLFGINGDISIINNDNLGAFVFSKKMTEDYITENPYNLVHNGNWTLDSFGKIIKNIAQDVNGDSRMDRDDIYGFMYFPDAAFCMYNACNTDFARKDADDIPYITIDEERSVNAFARIFSIVNNKTDVYSLYDAAVMYKNENAFEIGRNIFEANRALFYWVRLRDVQNLRNMQTDFGIVPLPKYDAAQESYRSRINNHTGVIFSIPVSNYNPNNTALLLDAMAAKGRYTILPAYYDINLTGKVIRDTESFEMLDIIFSNRVYDVGILNNIGGYMGNITTMVFKSQDNIVSTIEKAMKIATSDINKIIKNFGN